MSRAPTGKDESKSSAGNQPDILARKKDACEDATDFESDIIDDDCWNDKIRDIKDNPKNETEEKRHIKNEMIENYTGDNRNP